MHLVNTTVDKKVNFLPPPAPHSAPPLTIPPALENTFVSNTIWETQEELAKEAEAGGGSRGGMVLMGPALFPQELQFLVVYVFSAQDLPSFSSVGTPSVNAVMQVRSRGREGEGEGRGCIGQISSTYSGKHTYERHTVG